MTLSVRPRHLLDILRGYGNGIRYPPYKYGHALHLMAVDLPGNPDRGILRMIGGRHLPAVPAFARGRTLRRNAEAVSRGSLQAELQ
jgi:hypothetical protein